MFTREELIPIAVTDLTEAAVVVTKEDKELCKALTRYSVLVTRMRKDNELTKRDYNSRQANLQAIADLVGVRALLGIGILNKSQYLNSADKFEEEKEVDEILIDIVRQAARHDILKVDDDFNELFGVTPLTPEEKYSIALETIEELEALEALTRPQYKDYQRARIVVGEFEHDAIMVSEAQYKLKHGNPVKEAEDARYAAEARKALYGTNAEKEEPFEVE